jgi:UDPglucose--hexose-1-phosphate uridylyltransferase
VSEADLRIDQLTGATVVVTPWRQQRPNLPDGPCPFCPGGLEAPGPYDVRHIPNRWPALPDGRHEVILHSPDHDSSFPALGEERTALVVEMWSARTAVLGSRDDVAYVFVFENRGRMIGSTIEHPHSQVMAFGTIPPIPAAELSATTCHLCPDPASDPLVTRRPDPADGLLVARRDGWQAAVPYAPSWPYELLISPRRHVGDLPTAGPHLRRGLAAILVDVLTRMERLLGRDAPYMLWVHQHANDPAAHLHLHLAPTLRAPGVARHLAAAEFGAGVFFDPVDPRQAAAQWRSA